MPASDRQPTARRAVRTSTSVWMCLALVGAVLLVYGQVSRHEFVGWDDPHYITDNPNVQAGLTSETVRWAFASSHASNWHPLTWLSHMLDYDLFGSSPVGHHWVNVILHALNTVLLFIILRFMTGAPWPSFLVAALFALHPLRVESVAWASERKDVLSATFWMLSILAYASYVKHGGRGRYVLVLVMMSLGLMVKPMLVTLPLVLLLLDIWPLGRWRVAGVGETAHARGRPLGVLVLEKTPMLVLAAISSAATVWAQRSGGALGSMEHLPVVARVANALVSYVTYLWKTVWPFNLTFFYPHPSIVSPDGLPVLLGKAAIAGLVLAGITVVVLAGMRRRPHLAVGWLWYLGTLVPVIGLVQVGSQAMADRYTYLPLIGVYILIAWGAVELIGHKPKLRPVVAAVFGVVMIGLMAVTWFQVGTWRDSRALYEHALRVTSDNYVAHNNLGSVFEEQGDLARAMTHYSEAAGINADNAETHFNLGHIYKRQGDLERSVTAYRRALTLRPNFAEAHNNLANVLIRQRKFGEARTHLEQAIRSDPDYIKTYNNLGNLLTSQGKLGEAEKRLRQALQLDPDYAEAHNNLGIVLANQGKLVDAVASFERAVRLKPDYADARNNLKRARGMLPTVN